MFRRSYLHFFALCCALLTAGCDDDSPGTEPEPEPEPPVDGGVPPGPDGAVPDGGPTACVDDAFEDDDELDDATLFLVGEDPIEGIACPEDDDVIAVEADAPCPAEFRLLFSHADGDLDLLVLDVYAERIGVGDSVDDDEIVQVDLPEAGTYFAVIYGYDRAEATYAFEAFIDGHDGGDGQCAPLGECSLGYAPDEFGDCFDCAEGYHDGGDGSCVPVGTCARGHADGGDGSCWPLGTCSDGYHPIIEGTCIETAACDEGLDDGTGACAGQCARGYHDGGDARCVPRDGCSFGFQDAGDGTCQPLDMCVGDYVANAAGVCLAPLSCPEGADDPGEQFAQARLLPVGERLDGVICPGDTDLFAVERDDPCPTAISLRFAHDEGDLDLEWVVDLDDRNDLGETLALADSASDDERIVQRDAPGRYYVRVYGYLPEDSARYALRVEAAGHDGGDGTCYPFGVCAAGYALDGDGECTVCADGFVDGGDGLCVADGCAPGFHDGGDGACVPVDRCSPGFHDVGTGDCGPRPDCAVGYHDGGDGRCIADDQCVPGRALDPGGDCVCPEGLRDGGGGACSPLGVCADGYHDAGDGACVVETRCAPTHHLTPGLRCAPTAACEPGERDDGTGRCGDGCAEGFHDGGEGRCMAEGYCAPGWGDDGLGVCVEPGGCAPGHPADAAGLCLPELACPADDGAEPDSAWADARPLGAGAAATGIACPSDTDLFVVEQSPDCRRIARLAFAHVEADLDLVLYAGPDTGIEGAAAGPLAGAYSTGDLERLVIPAGSAGAVYVAVQAPPGASARYRIRLDDDGACDRAIECPAGAHPDGAGGCAPLGSCAPGFSDGGDGRCVPQGVCALGFVDGGEGVCLPRGQCQPGYHPDADLTCVATAECPAGERDDGLGACADVDVACAPGFHDGGDGACVPLGQCGARFGDDGAGVCSPVGVCAEGFEPDPADRCLPDLACPADDPAEGGAALADGVPGFGILCDATDDWALDLPADCAAQARLEFAHAAGDLSLQLVLADEVLDQVDGAGDVEVLIPGELPDDEGLRLRVAGAPGVRYALTVWCR